MNASEIRVLIACEYSQEVCKAFRVRGFQAYSCDLLPTEGNPRWHIQDNVLNHLNDGWHCMIAHDPCTYQCNSGVRWLHERPERWGLLRESCEFTRQLFTAKILLKARENPIPHKYAVELLGMDYSQCVQPHWFGDRETKATCLWLFGLPKLVRTHWITDGIKDTVHQMPPSDNRGLIRSRTFKGIAFAMAKQWGDYLLTYYGEGVL